MFSQTSFKRILVISFLAGLLSGNLNANAEEKLSLARRFSITDILTIGYDDNPRIAAARLRWKAVIQRYPQVTSYPDPFLKYSYFLSNLETRVGPQRQKFVLSQKIPFPGKLSLKGEIVNKEVEIAYQTYEQVLLSLTLKIKQAYYDYWYACRALELTRQNLELNNQLSQISETDLSLDGTTLTDVFKAQQQLAQLQYDLILIEEQKDTAKTRINSLLNLPPENELGTPLNIRHRTFKYSVQELYPLAEKYSQALKKLDLRIEKEEVAIELAEKEYYPDFMIGLSYADIGDSTQQVQPDDSGQDAYSINFGISIPLWLDRRDSALLEAKLNRNAAEMASRNRKNELFSDIKSVYFKINNSDRLVTLYSDSLIPQAAQTLQTAETWYKEKKGSLSSMLEVEITWLKFQLAHKQAIADYYRQVAVMESLVGKLLEMGEEK